MGEKRTGRGIQWKGAECEGAPCREEDSRRSIREEGNGVQWREDDREEENSGKVDRGEEYSGEKRIVRKGTVGERRTGEHAYCRRTVGEACGGGGAVYARWQGRGQGKSIGEE